MTASVTEAPTPAAPSAAAPAQDPDRTPVSAGAGPDPRRKRVFDVVVGGALIVLLAPLLGVLALAVLLSVGRPVLFRQDRVTGGGRIAEVIKFRTLSNGWPDDTPGGSPDTSWSVPPDRCGALARWLRATHLDELPQLVNVLRGEMSLVGPRPERPYFADRFGREIPGYDGRHRMRGGMTGWAQVHGLHGDTPIVERARFDNQYIDRWSLRLDLVILARTLVIVLAAMVRGSNGGTGAGR
ncbi:MAG TPA: sugar transferase [Pseudonocardiaceae bacterium]